MQSTLKQQRLNNFLLHHLACRYAKAFVRRDGERHRQYLDALREGKATIKGGRMYPHDIVHKLLHLSPKVPEQAAGVEQLEHQWNAMVKVGRVCGSMWE